MKNPITVNVTESEMAILDHIRKTRDDIENELRPRLLNAQHEADVYHEILVEMMRIAAPLIHVKVTSSGTLEPPRGPEGIDRKSVGDALVAAFEAKAPQLAAWVKHMIGRYPPPTITDVVLGEEKKYCPTGKRLRDECKGIVRQNRVDTPFGVHLDTCDRCEGPRYKRW